MAKIIVADKDASVCEALKTALTNAGYDVVTTSDSKEVLGLVWKGGHDLLVIDLGLDDLTLQTLRMAQPSLPGQMFPIIIFDSDPRGQKERVRVFGAIHVSKPDTQALIVKINEILKDR